MPIDCDLPITNSKLTDSTEGSLPGLTTTTVLGGTHDLGETGALHQRQLSDRHLLVLVAGGGIGGEDLSNLLGTLDPAGGGGGKTLSREGIVMGLVDGGVGGRGRHDGL